MITFFKNIFRTIRSKRFLYESLVKIVLDDDALIQNYKIFESIQPETRVAPVLKSNAYGHGLVLVAKKLDLFKPPFFVVDSYYEALILKNEGIQSDVLVIGYTDPENIFRAKKRGVVFTITTLSQLEKISIKLKHSTRFHIKIDTGMHRQGISISELSRAIFLIQKNKNIILEGMCSHFADADTENSAYTREQIKVWNNISARVKKDFPSICYSHTEATAGTAWADVNAGNVLRIGIGLYGIDSVQWRNLSLLPVLSMESIVVGIKNLKKGECVGYNTTYCAPHDMKIATVPVGYYEGVDRRLSNKGYIYVRDSACAIVGRVSMNMVSIDVSDVLDIKEGDRVEIISAKTDRKNSVVFMALLCETIPYEIVVRIPEKIKRVWK
jgi:alanine racemase